MNTRFPLLAAVVCMLTVSMAAPSTSRTQVSEPAPEHALLLERVGTWDCSVQMWMGPGEPLKMNAVETTRALGSFHVLSEFESELMGTPFSGHGVMSWDPAKKRFVSLWVDVMEPSPSLMEGTYDAESRTLSFVGENTMMGEKVKMREVLRHVDADHVVTELFATGKDGKETKSMQIDYARRK